MLVERLLYRFALGTAAVCTHICSLLPKLAGVQRWAGMGVARTK